MSGWKIGCLLSMAALISTWGVGAQVTPTPERVTPAQTGPPQTSVIVGAYEFLTDPTEPVLVYPIARSTNGAGSFVTWHGAVQLADGSFVGLTSCDNEAVMCVPIISPAKGALTLADPGDTFTLGAETTK